MGCRVGFVGTGLMGSPIARNLARAGHQVTAWNRTRSKVENLADAGIVTADQPVEVAREADAVVCMLGDGPNCDDVLFDGTEDRQPVLAGMAPGSLMIVMSSIPVETCREQALRASRAGVAYVDAPVSGGPPGAAAAKLAIMAGGSEEAFGRALPFLELLGRPVRVGPAGAGQLAKLCNNLIVGNALAAIAEALTLADAGGADADAVRHALAGGYADSILLQVHGKRMVERDFEVRGPAKFHLKDLDTASELAATLGLALPVTETVTGLFASMVKNGWGDRDHSGIWLEIQRINGLPINSW